VDKWLVGAVVAICGGARAVVGAVEGGGGAFGVEVELHRVSVLGPMLFVVVVEMVSGELQAGLPQGLLCADGLVLAGWVCVMGW